MISEPDNIKTEKTGQIAPVNETVISHREMNPAEVDMERTMATCHTLVKVKDQILGDPLDIHMFNLTGRDLKGDSAIKNGEALHVVKQFIFIPELQRMSVIVKFPDGGHHFYLKGSPEKVATLCKDIPQNYLTQIDGFAKEGLRVIALAGKPMEKQEGTVEYSKIKREDLESDLTFYGLLILGGMLKEKTIPTL
jgi:magnesium-transporting ATPase (P-type)